MHWSADYVGIPFEPGASSWHGADCWGLLRLVHLERYGRRLPAHDEAVGEAHEGLPVADAIIAGSPVHRIEMSDLAEGDALHLWGVHNGRRTRLHVGVVVAPGKLLHTEMGTGAIVEDLSSPRMIWRPIAAYRFA